MRVTSTVVEAQMDVFSGNKSGEKAYSQLKGCEVTVKNRKTGGIKMGCKNEMGKKKCLEKQ